MRRTFLFVLSLTFLILSGCDQLLITPPELLAISFDKNSEDASGVMEDQIVDSGDLVPIKENEFSRAGWEFAGWSTSPEGGALFYGTTNYILITEDTTLYATWAESHSLSYDGNGNTSGTVPLSTREYGTGMTVPVAGNTGNLAKDGFSFSGWNRRPDGSGTNYSEGEAFLMGESDVTLYARWIVNQTVSFNKNNENAMGDMPDQIIPRGASVPLHANAFLYPGWTFAGWAVSPEGIIVYADQWYFSMGDSNESLYAVWTQSPSHNVTFDANGGTGTMGYQTFREGLTALLAPNLFVRNGYAFAGWSTADDGTAEYADNDEFLIGSSDTTLYAVWSALTYELSFDKNHEDATGETAPQYLDCDSTHYLSANGFTRPGWSFAGWAASPSGSVVYADEADYTMGSEDTVLYAQWTPNTYSITFNSNDGDAAGFMAEQYLACESSGSLTANNFSKSGWIFSGWAETTDGPILYEDQALFTMGAEDVILYARWTPSPYTITFNKNDSEATGSMDDQVILNGSTETLDPNQFVKTGWSFAGWATSPGGEMVYGDEDPFIMEIGNVDLYALWEINSYHLRFDGNGMEPERSVTGSMNEAVLEYGEVIVLPVNAFSADFYVFAGWSTSQWGGGTAFSDGASFEMGSGDVTLYAQWTDISYSVIYDKNDENAVGDMSMSVLFANPFIPSMALNCSFENSGFTFVEWNTDPDGSGTSFAEWDYFFGGTGDLVLYAIWGPELYPIQFDKNDPAAQGFMDFQELVYLETGTLVLNGFVREEAHFSGWNTEPDGSGVSYSDGDSITMDTMGKTLYALWDINEYTITYYDTEASGGSVPGPQTVEAYSSVVLADNPGELVKNEDGLTFVLNSWALYQNGENTGIVFGAGDTIEMMASDMDLYAQWTALGATGPAGGIIIADKGSYSDGWRYIEASPSDLSSGISWNNGVNTDSTADGFDLGAGLINTSQIISSQGIGTYAAQLCDDYSIVNDSVIYDDWYLPSLMEMDAFMSSNFRGDLTVGSYWSSTSLTVDSAEAYAFDGDWFSPGSYTKDEELRVRAVRRF
ncbi:InlB B-repeat-containing protein [Spirochaeta isovalerica]|uniref:Putative repeat protein (TIGR02543 family) n=1 Tax=Spirochaeta isovalerica TaxID=150 RepID=A0A841RAR5_9SPIO|nr:InlB B-repeat-containing protein [Spirochaeta isovalerica]MBB6481013.1 putative repeat protein (TIGR02543 family) [Spirochaeta isovalerica]